jgi:hypothetical protein
MPKVKYLGGDTSQFGYDFKDGESVTVTDEKHLAKFKGNPHFEVSGDKSETEKPVTATTGLKAEHHGGGKFNITNGENVVQRGLSKADADAFNAMSDDEKLAYVSGASN